VRIAIREQKIPFGCDRGLHNTGPFRQIMFPEKFPACMYNADRARVVHHQYLLD
jgi:hypothetical protein